MGKAFIQAMDGTIVAESADEYKLTLSSKLDATDIRVEPIGDSYAVAVYDTHSGNYVKLGRLYKEAADLCARTLKNKKIDVESIKTQIKKAKQLCLSQADYCRKHRDLFEVKYESTCDIIRTLEGEAISTGIGTSIGVGYATGEDGLVSEIGPGKDGFQVGPGKDGFQVGPGKDTLQVGPGKDGIQAVITREKKS
jgi:hypothetical protein